MKGRATRRSALKALGAAAAAPVALDPVARLLAREQAAPSLDPDMLQAVADAVLPEEIGSAGRRRVVAAFLGWIQNYREGADTDHGYGFTRIRKTGPAPSSKYTEQLRALGRANAGSDGVGRFTEMSIEARRAAIAAALAEVKIDRLPGRPSGGHVVSDLMGFYFNSSPAADLCYRAQIGRDLCRGLEGSERPPAPLKTNA